MPHNKSTIKRLRQNVKERAYNRAIRTRTRVLIKNARQAEGSAVESAVVSAHAGLDRAVKLGVMPKRRAARLKSRLSRQANRQGS